MALQPTLSGARAKFGVLDPRTGRLRIKGVISQFSYNRNLDTAVCVTLGRFSPASIQYVGADAVAVTTTAWRNLGHTAGTEFAFPKIQEMLLYEPIVIVGEDRQAEATGGEPRIVKFTDVLPQTLAQGFGGRQLSEMTLSFIARLMEEEDGPSDEDGTATSFP